MELGTWVKPRITQLSSSSESLRVDRSLSDLHRESIILMDRANHHDKFKVGYDAFRHTIFMNLRPFPPSLSLASSLPSQVGKSAGIF